MPDHKFEVYKDRRNVLEDEKNRIIDFSDFGQGPPTVGIYDEPVRYFKANKEWCKFIFGWLTWMQSVSFWKDAEDSNHHAIQQVLIFEEGIEGGIFMTPDEFRDSLDAGLYSAFNKLARQIVSGRYTDIAVDEDGTVSQPSTGGASDVPDDPATSHNEELEARSGGAIAYAEGLAGVVAKMLQLYGADEDEDMPVAQAQFIMKSIYDSVDSLMDTAVAHYWTYRVGLFVPFTVIDSNELSEIAFCHWYRDGDILEWLYALSEPFEELQIIAELWGALSADQKSNWILDGQKTPSTEYIAYDCTPNAPESFSLDMSTSNTPSYALDAQWKPNHRFLIEIEGSFTDSDNPGIVRDGMWSYNAGTGVKTFEPITFSAANVSNPTALLVPYRADHKYRFTVERTGLAPGANTIAKDNGSFALPNVVGVLSFVVTDLGEF